MLTTLCNCQVLNSKCCFQIGNYTSTDIHKFSLPYSNVTHVLYLLISRVQSGMIFLSSHLVFLQYILHSVSSPLPACRLFVTACWQLATSWGLSTRGWRRRSSKHRRRNWPGGPRVLTQRSPSLALSGGRGWGIPRNTYYRNILTCQDLLTEVLVLISLPQWPILLTMYTQHCHSKYISGHDSWFVYWLLVLRFGPFICSPQYVFFPLVRPSRMGWYILCINRSYIIAHVSQTHSMLH